MALSEKKKEEILADFNTGDYNQRQLVEKHNVGKGTISRLLKGLKATNGALKNKVIQNIIIEDEIVEQMGQLSAPEKKALQKSIETGYDQLKKTNKVAQNYQDLIIEKQDSNIELINMLKERRDMLIAKETSPKKMIEIFGSYNAKIDELVDLQAVKHGAEANDKLAMTQGHVERHAPRAIQAVQINHDNTDPDSRPKINDDMSAEEATKIYLESIK